MNEYNDKNKFYINGNVGSNYTVNRSYTRKKRSPFLVIFLVALIAFGAGGGGAYFVMRGMMPAYTNETAANTDASMVVPADVVSLNSAAADGNITTVAEKASASVVEITIESMVSSRWTGQSVASGSGSGVIFTEDGYIITNNHVVSGASSVWVTMNDGTEYQAQVIGTDAETDLALIKIDAHGLTPAEFADSGQIKVGEMTLAIGNPLGQLGGTVTDGIVSATEREITISGESMTLIQTSAAVSPGNSGGGLFDSSGRLIGIVNAKLSGSEVEGLAFAIPSNTVIKIINELLDNGYVSGRTELGLYVVEVADEMTAAMYRLSTEGVYIAYDDSALGLVSGDRVVSLNGSEILALSDIDALLETASPGDIISLVIERDGQQLSGDITLAEQSGGSDSGAGYSSQNSDVVKV